MKLTEIKLVDVLNMHMHESEEDCMVEIWSQESLDRVRGKLMAKFGDVEVEINPGNDWFHRVRITSSNWIEANKAYCDKKAADLAIWGCN